MQRQEKVFRRNDGHPPHNLPVGDAVLHAADPTGVDAIAREALEVRPPENALQFVEASLSAVEYLIMNDGISRNDRAFSLATRLAQRLEEYLVASPDSAQDGTEDSHAPARTPSLFAQDLFQGSEDQAMTVVRTEFVIEINSLVRELWKAIQEEHTVSQSTGQQFQQFDDVAARLRVGEAERTPEAFATAMQMPMDTVFAQFPELLNEQLAVQRKMILQNPFAPQYAQYWQDRRRSTAIVRGIESPRPEQLPALSDLIAGRGEHAAFLLTEEREQLEQSAGDNRAVIEAIELLEDFLGQTSADIDSINTNDQVVLARRLVNLNLLRERPENTIALLNACETLKQHNPELFFRLLGTSTSLSDGTATESDLFGNPLMIALDQTNRDLATRKVSAGFGVLRDRIDSLLSTDPADRRSALPYLNEQQLRAAEEGLQAALRGTDEAQGPNVIAMTMMLKYTPALELGKLMREVGFERRGEYVERIRNGTPREILADLMDMPEELFEDPEVIAAWRERYNLDHPDDMHRIEMNTALVPYLFLPKNNVLSDEEVARSLIARHRILQASKRGVQARRSLSDRVRGRFVPSSDIVDTLYDDPTLALAMEDDKYSRHDSPDKIVNIQALTGMGDSPYIGTSRLEEKKYIANFHAFILGLFAHAPKELYARPAEVLDSGEVKISGMHELLLALRGAYKHPREISGTFDTISPTILLPREEWMSDRDWQEVPMPDVVIEEYDVFGNQPNFQITQQSTEGASPQVTVSLYDNFIRSAMSYHQGSPGRLFASLIEVNSSFRRTLDSSSMYTCLHLQPAAELDSAEEHDAFVQKLQELYGSSDRQYINVHFGNGDFQLIGFPEKLTPLEKRLNDIIEPIVVGRIVEQLWSIGRDPVSVNANRVSDLFRRAKDMVELSHRACQEKFNELIDERVRQLDVEIATLTPGDDQRKILESAKSLFESTKVLITSRPKSVSPFGTRYYPIEGGVIDENK
jgi:hypothetical protein